ncbi:MAG TPA: CusA/CzcA family heavy metal efflux RND transporter [Bryobacteraceae bacterium]|nr:CusA/CzcA family heavy metal efflux RND transporter [Bryobacteraceae bacterium]
MLRRIIDFSLDNRWIVVVGLCALMAGGLYTVSRLPIEAFPDLTNNQVVVVSDAPGMSPVEVEQLVTYPIESALVGLPRTENVRSVSKLGLSVVTLIFEDSVDQFRARQLVTERLSEVREHLPQGIVPALLPMATAFGEVFQYTVEGPQPLMERKAVQDWQVRTHLRTVAGVGEVNSWGGETRQIAIEADPLALQRYGLTLRDVIQRVADNNANFGAGYIEHAEEQYTVRGLGRASGAADLERIVVASHAGVPVLLRDVAAVRDRPLQRQGATLRDARGETVSAMVIMLKGENGRSVIGRIKARLARIRLPEGMRIVPFYDQSEVIDGTLHTVTRNLLEAGLLVVAVLLLFLGSPRAALIVAAVIPLSMLFGFMGMAVFGVSANLMSLGAVDFGMIVDGGVVMMENFVRRVHGREGANIRERVRVAGHEVARPIVFAVAIIIAVYLPILTLEGLEGRMFRPMAITVCAALLGSLLLALTAVPALASLALRSGAKEHGERLFARLRDGYRRSLEWHFRHRALVLAGTVAAVAVALGSVAFIGTEFMPRLDEGAILITTRKLPGISLSESIDISNRVERVLRGFPEVRSVVSRLGRPDLATESMGIYEADVYLLLQPVDKWQCCRTKNELIAKLTEKLETIPGVAYNFTQPMAMRMDEVISGIKADVALKIFGDDPAKLEQLASRALAIISEVPGARDTQMEVISGVAELRVDVERAALARYGLNVSDVREVIQSAVAGVPVSELIDGQRRFPIAIRLPDAYRSDPARLAEVPLQAPGGERVRLDQLARISVVRGPEVVSREGVQRRIVVQANVRDRDLGGFVSDAQDRIANRLALPAGYSIDWGGQFENQQRANRRLMIVLPLSIGIIFGLLFATFHSVRQALLIFLNVPFALVGGIAALWLRQMHLNLSASVGFIALFGVAVLNGIVMISYINTLREQQRTLSEAVFEGAATRLRPVLMTALVASLGFLPMALSTSTGAEVQRPLATVVIGGLVTSTFLTLYILPLLYPWFAGARRFRALHGGTGHESAAALTGAHRDN